MFGSSDRDEAGGAQYHIIKSWLINGEHVAVPSRNARLADINHDNLKNKKKQLYVIETFY